MCVIGRGNGVLLRRCVVLCAACARLRVEVRGDRYHASREEMSEMIGARACIRVRVKAVDWSRRGCLIGSALPCVRGCVTSVLVFCILYFLTLRACDPPQRR